MVKIDDIAAEYSKCRKEYQDYPLNLLRTEVFGHRHRSLLTRLNQEGYFHSSHQALYVRDLREAETEFDRGRALKSVEDIERLLGPEEKNPWWRFMLVYHSSQPEHRIC